jgi:NAD-dependent histone deacetylase SIR2
MRTRSIQRLGSTATSIVRQFRPYRYIPRFPAFNIGRKYKGHRQQAQQERPWRNAEKGRRGKGKGKRDKMGQDESRVIDPSAPPQTLKARTLEALAQYIKDGRAQKIVIMVGAVTIPDSMRVLMVGRQEQA